MEIRGERECLDCGETWSYFETREPACPECGSLRSRAVEDADEDTTGAVETGDLLTRFGGEFDAALGEAEDRCREYTSRTGFVRGGELYPPEPTYVMACEVKHIAAEFVGEREPTDEEREYVVALVEGVETGDPPSPDDRPESLDAAHNQAVAETVEEYAKELSGYLRGVGETDGRVEEARDLAKRTQATDGSEDDAVEGLRLLRDVYDELS